MSKYIDADKLIAEIERFRATEYDDNTLGDDVANGALDYVLEEIIPSLQQEQPEVNLEKELEKYCRIYYNCNYPEQIQNGTCSPVMPHIVEAARHFAEWGAIHLNARKED